MKDIVTAIEKIQADADALICRRLKALGVEADHVILAIAPDGADKFQRSRRRLVLQPTDHELGDCELLLAVGAGALHLGLHQCDEVFVIRRRALPREPLGHDGV
jgi:hypothetical protein